MKANNANSRNKKSRRTIKESETKSLYDRFIHLFNILILLKAGSVVASVCIACTLYGGACVQIVLISGYISLTESTLISDSCLSINLGKGEFVKISFRIFLTFNVGVNIVSYCFTIYLSLYPVYLLIILCYRNAAEAVYPAGRGHGLRPLPLPLRLDADRGGHTHPCHVAGHS